jgi:CRISPR-associated endoribonuclease Cas6
MRFKCLSPLVVAVHDPQRRTPRYLRPDDPEFSERVRQNLLAKHAALHGQAPTDDRLSLTFDADYLKTHKGTKLTTYKGIHIVGAFCPFTLSGSIELMRVGYECGLGEKNAGGFGMIEVIESGNRNSDVR